MRPTRMQALQLLAALALLAGGAAAQAQQAFPSKTITIVAPNAAGGPGDTAARLMAEYMAPLLGAQIVVENVPGAGGTLGATRVARSEPDGHTLLVHQTGITVAPSTSSNVSFDVTKDLAVVGLVNVSASVLVGRKTLPVDDFKGLLGWMKGNPAKFAHAGNGTLGYLTIAVMTKSLGIPVDGVSYRGVAPALNDIVGGHVDLLFAGLVSAAPQVRAGTMKGFAIVGDKRSKLLPDVPTVVELGMPELAAPFWYAMFAPVATPRAIVEKLNAALRQSLQDPKLLKVYEETSVEAFPAEMLTVEAATRFVHSEVDRWGKVAAEARVKSSPAKE